MEIKVELDIDQVTKLVREQLIEDVKIIYDISTVESETAILNSLENVIKYYSTKEQWDEYREMSNKLYVDYFGHE